ncbi:MAG: NAD(P)-dependent oxidoreductase, partial [Loktanella sp.]|nr:NAD(P)-dependent oxidoreductase [Loktanella sp.]
MRVFFTGGSGKAGRHAVAYLRAQGHHVINADQTLSGDGTNELQVDLMDFGQVIGAMSQFVDFDELNTGQGVPKYDAVVHFAAVPRVMIGTDGECFKANTQTTYN